MIKIKKAKKNRIVQGDILKDIEFIEYAEEKGGSIEISKINFPYIIVLTQDCDLLQDYNDRWSRIQNNSQDKLLLSVLVAPIYNAEHVYSGEHLSELNLKMQLINKNRTPGKYIRNNEIPRYHFVEFPAEVGIVPSIIDFKHYFSVNISYLRKNIKEKFVCSVSALFREDITNRFSNFLSRIGLP